MAKKNEIDPMDMHAMIEWGFALFLFGAVFWVSSYFSWMWYQSVTALGLLIFLFGWVKLSSNK